MKRLLTLILVLTGTVVLAFGQDVSKFSTGTQMIISARDGGMTLQSPVSNKRRNLPSGTPGAVRSSADDFPYAVPFKLNGVQMVTCWISLTDQDYRSLERLGVRIQERFKGRVTAQVPVDNLEKVAELKNVTKISVARRLRKNTYRARVLTNVDDVLNLSNDAQTAGLLQAMMARAWCSASSILASSLTTSSSRMHRETPASRKLTSGMTILRR